MNPSKPYLLALFIFAFASFQAVEGQTKLGASLNQQDFGRLAAWEAWTGQDAGVISDSFFANTWADLDASNLEAGTGSALSRWQLFLESPAMASRENDIFEFALPMFPSSELNNPNRWQEVLDGDHDAEFTNLAIKLVETGFHDCQLRLAWEFNIGATVKAWSIFDLPGTWNQVENGQVTSHGLFAQVWQHIHTVMQNAPHEGYPAPEFKWVWSVLTSQASNNGFDPRLHAYPGDTFVDIISVDIYDEQGGLYWDLFESPKSAPGVPTVQEMRDQVWEFLTVGASDASGTILGLNDYRAFAAEEGKIFGISEWGIVEADSSPFCAPDPTPESEGPIPHNRTHDKGGSDNPDFISKMHTWIMQNDVDYAAYFEFALFQGLPGAESSQCVSHAIMPNYWNDPNYNANPLHPHTHPNPQSAAKFLELFYGVVSGQAPGAVSEDFDDNTADGWNLGGWEIGGGQLQAPWDGGWLFAMMEGDDLEPPFTVKVDLKFDEAWEYGGFAVLHNGTEGYQLTITSDDVGQAPLVKLWRGDDELLVLNGYDQDYVINPQWDLINNFEELSLTVSLEGEGLRFRAYIGSDLVLDHPDATPLSTSGRVGIACSADSQGTLADNFAFIPASQPPPSSGNVLANDDFEEWQAPGWIADPNGWFATRRGYRCLSPSESKTTTKGDYSWSNYCLRAKLCIVSSWQPAILHAYVNEQGQGYSFEFRANEEGNLSHVVFNDPNGDSPTVFLENSYPIASLYQDVAITIQDADESGSVQVICELNGQELFNVTDDSPTSDGGKIAIEAAAWSIVSVDDVSVTEVEP